MIDVVPNAGVIALGKQGENRAVRVTLPNIRAGSGSILLLHQRSDDQKPYPVPVVEADRGIIWTVSSTDTAYPGRGQAELQWLGADGAVVKSVTYQTNIIRALTAPGAVPDEPLKPYTQAVAKDAQAAKNAAASATEAARSAEASAGQAGISAENAAKTLKRLEDGIASGDFRGEKGEQGEQGEKGDPGPQGPQGEVGPAGDTTAADAAAEAAKNAAQEAQKAAETAVLYTEQNLTNSQQERARANIGAADKARQNILLGTEIGNPIAVDDAFSAPLCGLTVYGKGTQDGTPTPDAPVPILSAGDGGSVAVILSDGNGKTQTLTLPTPNGLPGTPVTSGGNYTDSTGQQWVCDEVDLERGVKVQRVDKAEITSTYGPILSMNQWDKLGIDKVQPFRLGAIHLIPKSTVICTALPGVVNGEAWSRAYECIGGVGAPEAILDFYIANERLGTTAETTAKEAEKALRNWLKTNPFSFIYALATPIETPLTPAELAAYKALTAYAPDTVVQASDGAGVKLEYQRDVNIVIKNLEDAIASMTAT